MRRSGSVKVQCRVDEDLWNNRYQRYTGYPHPQPFLEESFRGEIGTISWFIRQLIQTQSWVFVLWYESCCAKRNSSRYGGGLPLCVRVLRRRAASLCCSSKRCSKCWDSTNQLIFAGWRWLRAHPVSSQGPAAKRVPGQYRTYCRERSGLNPVRSATRLQNISAEMYTRHTQPLFQPKPIGIRDLERSTCRC